MDMRKKLLGAEHPHTLTSMGNLAATYRNQGKWNEAEQLDVQMMNMRKNLLGAEHPDTLSGMADLAATYRNQGKWSKAEDSSNPSSGGVMTLGDHHQLLVEWLPKNELNKGADQSNAIGMCIADILYLLCAE